MGLPLKTDADGVGQVALNHIIAGERNQSSSTNSYLDVRRVANATRADIDTTETVITDAPAHLIALVGNDANTGYTQVRDASATGGGATPLLQVNLGDGGVVDCAGVYCANGITVDGESAGHDITVLWRPA